MIAVVLVCATLASPVAVFGALVGLLLEKNYSIINKVTFAVCAPVFILSVAALWTWF